MLWVKLHSRVSDANVVVINGCPEKTKCRKFVQNAKVRIGTQHESSKEIEESLALKRNGSLDNGGNKNICL